MTKKTLYVIMMVFGMLALAPQDAKAQFGLFKKKNKTEKTEEIRTIPLSEVLQLMSEYPMTDRETLATITQAYKNTMGAGKEILAVNAKHWFYKRDDFGNILFRRTSIMVQYTGQDGNMHLHMLRCEQEFNGAGYDELQVYEDPMIVSYRDRIIER